MSGPPDTFASSVSTAGYEDGLGRRSVRFNREVGGMLECLHLRPQFLVFEAALRARAEELTRLDDERFARVREFESDATGLRVISELVTGHRLIDVLDTRPADDGVVSGIDAAFGFLLQAMPALAELHGNGITHGAVAPGRIILTPNSQVVLLDGIYAGALERLNLGRRALWTSFGIMAPPIAGAAPLDRYADVGQVSLCALLLAAGRPLDDTATVASLVPLVREVAELAEIRAGTAFADGVSRLFDATLPAAGKHTTTSAEAAAAEVRRLVAFINEDESLNALAELVCYRPAGARSRIDQVSEESAIRPAAEPVPPAIRPEVIVAPVAVVSAAVAPVTVAPAAAPPVAVTAAAPLPAPPALLVPEPRAVVRVSVQPPEPVQLAVAAQGEVSAPPSPAPILETPPTPVAVYQAQPVALYQPPPAPVFHAPPIPLYQPPTIGAQAPRVIVGPPLPAPLPSGPSVIPASVAPQASPAVLKIREEKPPGYAPIRLQERETPSAAEPTARALSFLDRAGAPERTFPWKIAAAAVLVLVIGGAAGRDYLLGLPEPAASTTPPPAATPAPPVSTTTGGLTIDSQPPGATVTLDGKEVGITPLTLDSVQAGRHQVTIVSGGALVQRSVRIEAGKQVAINVPVFSGWVAIFAPIRLDVAEGRRSLGSTESGRILLSPGRHVLTISNAELGYSAEQTVVITAGEERVLNLRPTGLVNLNASPWAEVWVDGTRAGETPLANLEVPLGTREFVFKHPQFGERRLTATITTKGSALSVDFGRPPSTP